MPAPAQTLRAIEQLAAELEAGRFESALAQHLLGRGNPLTLLLRACFLAEHGQLERAREDVGAALRQAPPTPVLDMVAGTILYVTHDYQRALELFDRAAQAGRTPATIRRARQLAINACVSLGWDHDALARLERACADDREHVAWHVQTVRAYARGHWGARALDHARTALALAPANASLWMEVAGMHAALDQREQALAALEQALTRAPHDAQVRYLHEAARVAIDASAFGRARELFEQVLARAPERLDVHVELAELDMWIDDDAAARSRIERVLASKPELGPALRILGALELRAGDVDHARSSLARAITLAPDDYQAYVWLAELELRARNYEQAHAWLHEAVSRAGGYLVVASLLRYLVVAYDEGTEPGELVAYNRTDEFEAVLREVAPEPTAIALRSRGHDDMLAAVEAALAALRGNRSTHATHVLDGALVRLHGQSGCRHDSRQALQLLRVADPATCIATFDEVVARYPHSSLPLCHRGELQLWLGDWQRARADLEGAIAKVIGTRWAYMGLSTLDLLAGDPEACLATNARGVTVMRESEGPAIYVFRGESLRLLGRLDEAIEQLERSVVAHPARAAAVIDLALAWAAKHARERVLPLWRRLAFDQACGLISDAARELAEGLALAGPAQFGEVPTPAANPAAATWLRSRDDDPPLELIVAILERALAMMGGNRSSGLLTYWTTLAPGRAQLRFVQQWPRGGVTPHTHDDVRIAQAKQLLVKAVAR